MKVIVAPRPTDREQVLFEVLSVMAKTPLGKVSQSA